MEGKTWRVAGADGNAIALKDDSGRFLTHAQLEKRADAVAEAAGGRSLVFCLCKNSLGSVCGYAGFLRHGIVPVMLSAELDDSLLLSLVEAYRPAFAWAPRERKMPGASGAGGFSAVYEDLDYVLYRNAGGEGGGLHPDLALLLTTSGSTGSPKLVRQSYANIRANTKSIISYLGIGAGERAITTLPMNYTYGLSIINTHLAAGAMVLLTECGIMQRGFWDFFRAEGATSFGGVPYTYEMLDRLRMQRMDLPTLRTMTQAGGKLSPGLHEKFAMYARESGKKFVVMYGQCEATARMGYLPPEMALEKKGSMGIAIPGGKFRLIGEDGGEVREPRVTGELVYEGENVTMGYAERLEDLMLGDERHGVLMTGDLAQFDEDGYYYIVGRKKRFLKIYGNRVSLDEVEGLIKDRLHVEAACAGRDDEMCIFLKDAARAEEVRAFASEVTRLNPAAFRTIAVGEIPKNEAGKVLYRELEEMAREGQG